MNFLLHKTIQSISGLFPLKTLQYLAKKRTVLPCYHAIVDGEIKVHLKHLNFYRFKTDFKSDLDFFSHYFKSKNIDEFEKHKNSFHLSFDDGLEEFYSNAFPLIKEKKIDVTLFINSAFIDNKSLFYKHKISLLIEEIILQKKEALLTEFYPKNSDLISVFKNSKFDDDQKYNFIAEKLNVNFEQYLSTCKPYLTTQQLLELKREGVNIANHGSEHINFNELNFEQQKSQFFSANEFIKDKLHIGSNYFAFPFGDEAIKNEFFDFLFDVANVQKSFGIAGIKDDEFSSHYHRILIEKYNLSAEKIIKFEYLSYLLKKAIGKHVIYR